MITSVVKLETSNVSVSLLGKVGERAETGLFFTSLAGWYSNPDMKVTQTERQTGNGAFGVPENEVLYAARTVTVGVTARAGDRASTQSLMDLLLMLSGKSVTMTVIDDELATFSKGYARVEFEEKLYERAQTATVTVVCPDPRRLSVDAGSCTLTPATSNGGLTFDSNACLVWPVTFAGESSATNVSTISNGGTSTAYPIITVGGSMPDGFTITDASTGLQLSYSQPVSWSNVVLDCRDRTASIAGVDVTRNLVQRNFPKVPPKGSVTLVLNASGNGFVSVECRDTYV